MPGSEHEITSRAFYDEIKAHVAQTPGHDYRSVVGVGAARYRCPGKRSKEGDDGLKCPTRLGTAAWPNLMIEVGYSEPLCHSTCPWHGGLGWIMFVCGRWGRP